jgi:hypothetical protein
MHNVSGESRAELQGNAGARSVVNAHLFFLVIFLAVCIARTTCMVRGRF